MMKNSQKEESLLVKQFITKILIISKMKHAGILAIEVATLLHINEDSSH